MLQYLGFILLQIDSTNVTKASFQEWMIALADNHGAMVFSITLLFIAYVLKIWMATERATLNAVKLSVDIPIDLSLLVMTAYASIDHSSVGGQIYVSMVLGFLFVLLVGIIIARCYFLKDKEKDAKEQSKCKQVCLPIICYLLFAILVLLSIKL